MSDSFAGPFLDSSGQGNHETEEKKHNSSLWRNFLLPQCTQTTLGFTDALKFVCWRGSTAEWRRRWNFWINIENIRNTLRNINWCYSNALNEFNDFNYLFNVFNYLFNVFTDLFNVFVTTFMFFIIKFQNVSGFMYWTCCLSFYLLKLTEGFFHCSFKVIHMQTFERMFYGISLSSISTSTPKNAK